MRLLLVSACLLLSFIQVLFFFVFFEQEEGRKARPRKDSQYRKHALFILEDTSIHGHHLEHLELLYLTVILAKIHRYMSKTPCGTAQLSYKTRIKLSIRPTKTFALRCPKNIIQRKQALSLVLILVDTFILCTGAIPLTRSSGPLHHG